METFILLLLLGAFVLMVVMFKSRSKAARKPQYPKVAQRPPEKVTPQPVEKKKTYVARYPVTRAEKPMHKRLVEAFPPPQASVSCQMSFGALLNAQDDASYFDFTHKRADFVVMDEMFRVLAIVELDDSSHIGREKEDAARAAPLIQAGYRVLRYTSVPSVETLRADIPLASGQRDTVSSGVTVLPSGHTLILAPARTGKSGQIDDWLNQRRAPEPKMERHDEVDWKQKSP